mmetsp:Transcript_12622/g.45402  ORF Transcript_12622/g.45402 Transcript_12622/m.45402 type:complete len:353 (+) Transcript_12622:1196-2254(+)
MPWVKPRPLHGEILAKLTAHETRFMTARHGVEMQQVRRRVMRIFLIRQVHRLVHELRLAQNDDAPVQVLMNGKKNEILLEDVHAALLRFRPLRHRVMRRPLPHPGLAVVHLRELFEKERVEEVAPTHVRFKLRLSLEPFDVELHDAVVQHLAFFERDGIARRQRHRVYLFVARWERRRALADLLGDVYLHRRARRATRTHRDLGLELSPGAAAASSSVVVVVVREHDGFMRRLRGGGFPLRLTPARPVRIRVDAWIHARRFHPLLRAKVFALVFRVPGDLFHHGHAFLRTAFQVQREPAIPRRHSFPPPRLKEIFPSRCFQRLLLFRLLSQALLLCGVVLPRLIAGQGIGLW